MPYEGLYPTTPQYAAGSLTDPPVSVPSATSAAPDRTATALPPELPPALRRVVLLFLLLLFLLLLSLLLLSASALTSLASSCTTAPWAELTLCVPMPNSSRFVLPTTWAPRAFSCLTMVASKGEPCEERMPEAQVVGRPLPSSEYVAMLSLTARRNEFGGGVPSRLGGEA